MPLIQFTSALKRFYPHLKPTLVDAHNIKEVLVFLELSYPNITDYLMDEHGALRNHINIFIAGKMIADRENLSDTINEKDEILIFQALSGG